VPGVGPPPPACARSARPAALLAFAQMEARAIQERVSGARAAPRGMTRWPGGMPPYGYQLAPNPDGSGYLLEHDPVASEAVTKMVEWLVEENVATEEISRRLTLDPKYPAPRDHARRRKGRKEEGVVWYSSTVRHILTGKASLGSGTALA
jgi:site-specific DNA recombinase